MTPLTERYEKMMALAAELSDIDSANALLSWDQETKMPKKGIEGRAQVTSTLAGVYHDKLTAPELRDILLGLKDSSTDLPEDHAAQVGEFWRVHDKALRLPGDLVRRLAEAKSRSAAAWAEAREEKNFPKFAPHLKEMMKLQREVAEALGYEGHPYNALLDEYEPDARIDRIEKVLAEVREFLVPVVKGIADSGREPDLSCVLGPFDKARQEQFGLEVVKAMGFDLEAGRIDISQHPFCSGIHPGDVRLTARYKDDIRIGLFGCMHEAGHGMYEQGALDALGRTPLGHVHSLGIHESQSRLWENNVGLSKPFWTAFFPRLKELFPEVLGNAGLDAFYAAVNDVRPSFIRIEADEVTYNLHIVVRFEIEKDLLTGSIDVDDLPGIWNEKYTKYLGITPPSDDVGVLQDIHWSFGLVGYFPTYTLGSLNAAQFYATARRAMPDLEEKIAAGNLLPLREWLRENVHRHGCRFKPQELMERVTGRPTSAADFIDHVKAKYGPLYGI